MIESLLKWVAEYVDGSSLNNIKEDISSERIDRFKLRSFIIIDITGNKILQLHLEKGDRFAYRCRNILRVDGSKTRLHIIALTRNENEMVIFINESDLIVEIGKYSQPGGTGLLDKYKYPITPVESDNIIIGK